MIYKKPTYAVEGLRFQCRNDSPSGQGRELIAFLDSLPDSFEIVEPGNVQVRWPEGVTRSELDGWCDDLTRYVPENADILRYLRQLAAIAPEEKKKRKLELWRHQNSAGIHIFAAGCNPNGSEPPHLWRKVGECEVDE